MNNILIIGSFESFHNGHYKLYKKAKKIKGKINFLIINLLNEMSSYFYSIENRKYIINQLANTYVYDLDINKTNMEAKEFIEMIKNKYNPTHIVVGSDFKFGKNRQGNISLLKKHFEVKVLKVYKWKISTSKIAVLLKERKIKKANKKLYSDFFIESSVVQGNQLARQLGYPTINFMLQNKKVCPGDGVYSTYVVLEDKKYSSITFISNYNNMKKVETHILNFNKDLYGQNIKVFFSDFIRLPIKYEGKQSIMNQIQKDISNIRC